MSSNYVCLACRRVVQQRTSTLAKSQTVKGCFASNQSYKSFSTIHKHAAPTATASKPIPHQAKTATTTRTSPPPSAPQKPTPKVPLKKPSTTKSIAKSIRETMPAATETYIAYGACEKLVQECTRQAEYHIPQATQKGVEIPRTKEGTELGVGEGWWYQSTRAHSSSLSLLLHSPSLPDYTIHNPTSTSQLENANEISPLHNSTPPPSHLRNLGPSHLPTHVPPDRPIPLFPSLTRPALASTSHRPFLVSG